MVSFPRPKIQADPFLIFHNPSLFLVSRSGCYSFPDCIGAQCCHFQKTQCRAGRFAPALFSVLQGAGGQNCRQSILYDGPTPTAIKQNASHIFFARKRDYFKTLRVQSTDLPVHQGARPETQELGANRISLTKYKGARI